MAMSCCWYMYIWRWTSEYCFWWARGERGGWGELGLVDGVPAALEPWEDAKLAGWKRGNDGKRRLAAVPCDDDWRM